MLPDRREFFLDVHFILYFRLIFFAGDIKRKYILSDYWVRKGLRSLNLVLLL